MSPNERTGEISRKKELNEMEASKLPIREFKTMIIRLLKELSENFGSIKDIETRKKQSEIKNTIMEMKTTLPGINRLDEAEDQISSLEDKGAENTQSEQQKEKRI